MDFWRLIDRAVPSLNTQLHSLHSLPVSLLASDTLPRPIFVLFLLFFIHAFEIAGHPYG